ncbi:RND family efflux transporter MFP subunit [Natranaerovirga hydrolytica]|uniref:RND family efflux transporter MFP subunit n=1 Tax=Natranaerovirga hydrolytica TaxID=680378 RepID=A0A4R1MJ96_9FIRM|nr:efflux RND transporter periplasmic adaptor subunit [Natranaerovirga hydrolytica]TCK92776.1 RND family efflux transporter MFP subunit [Natranaerovirga hydrolytica]
MNKNKEKKWYKSMIFKLSTLVVVIGIVGVFYLNSLQGEEQEVITENNAKPLVEVMEMGRRDLHKKTNLIGHVQSGDTRAVMPQISGEVLEVYVQEGDFVQKGDVLLKIDDTDYKLQSDEARIGLNAARIQLEEARSGASNAQLIEADTSVEQAKKAVEQLEKEYDRITRLYEENFVSIQEYEQVKMQYDNAREQLRLAKAYQETTEEGATEHQIAALESQIDRASLGVELANQMVERTVVRAPIDGQIVSVEAKAGDLIGTTGYAFIIMNEDNMQVSATVPESYINNIYTGQDVVVNVPAAKSTHYDGVINTVGKMPPEGSRAYPIEISLENEDELLRMGMYSSIEMIVESALDTLYVPRKALIMDNEAYYVFVVNEENTVERVKVKTGLSENGYVAITEGLNEGQQVVIEGTNVIEVGDEVKISTPNQESAKARDLDANEVGVVR